MLDTFYTLNRNTAAVAHMRLKTLADLLPERAQKELNVTKELEDNTDVYKLLELLELVKNLALANNLKVEQTYQVEESIYEIKAYIKEHRPITLKNKVVPQELLEHLSETNQMHILEERARAIAAIASEGIYEEDVIAYIVKKYKMFPSQVRIVITYGEYSDLFTVSSSGLIRTV